MHMAPGQVAVDIFGGVRRLARAICVNPGTVIRWHRGRYNAEPRTPEAIPTKHIKAIIVAAAELGLKVNVIELIEGREVSDEQH